MGMVGLKAGFNIRGMPKAKPLVDKTAAPAQTSATGKAKSKSGTKGRQQASWTRTMMTWRASRKPGCFLAWEDIEELFTIIRTQTKLFVAR